MGLLNSRLGLILIYAGSMCIFSIWNLKGYFDTIPIEIEEASKIDGASDFKMLWKIIMPPCYACSYCHISYGFNFCME